jgi:hypothetical protein
VSSISTIELVLRATARTAQTAARVVGVCSTLLFLACSNETPDARPRAGAGGTVAGAGGAGKSGTGAAGRPSVAGQGGAGAAAGSGGSNASGAGGAGSGGAGASGSAAAGSGGAVAAGSWWRPKPGTSWQWQLTGKLDTSFDVDAYDIDLFTNAKSVIDGLHTQGRKVICYFDTAYEPDRPDSKQLEPFRGNPIDGWPGQYWLDVREAKVLEVMKSRLAMAKSKGCDGVEADDVDARSNDPGFPIKAADQQAFIKAIADEAHALGMAFGLKNDLEEIAALLSVSDFAVNEECFEYDECDALEPFIRAGKAVFQVEYTDGNLDTKASAICPDANQLNFDTLIKHLDLDAPRKSCR